MDSRLLRAIGPATLVTVAVVVMVASLAYGGGAAPLVIADAGPVVRWGLPTTTLIFNLAAAGLLGSLILALFALKAGLYDVVKATIDTDGFMQITDRSKDVIKSGGEWISSIDIENIAMAHPAVAMAACVGVRHPKWDERPIVVVVKKPGLEVERDELLKFYEGKTAKWQIPDDVVFVDAIPLGATGKMLKTELRKKLIDYRLPGT